MKGLQIGTNRLNLGIFACFYWSSADFFQNQVFRKKSFRNTIRVLNRLDPDQARHLSGLIWVQAVCKSYEQTTIIIGK